MLNEVIDRLVNGLNENIDERDIGEPNFDKNHYDIFPLNKEGFHKIEPFSSRKMVFIDGGNQELLGGPNFSIQLNRVYFNIFKEKKGSPGKDTP